LLVAVEGQKIAMFTRDTAWIACGIALFYGTYMLRTRPDDGPFVTGYRLLLIIGGTIGVFFLWFTSRKGPEVPQSHEQSKTGPDVSLKVLEQPKWMGDPEGNRRRMRIILTVFAVLGTAAAIFLMTR
jgi:hypothetical protein